jgi:hypothetical protein
MNWFGFELSAFLWVFIILNIINVVIQTVKSIVTISGGKVSASVVNAVAYGLYTVVVVYMNADGLGLFWKALIIGLANLVGVYVVKLIEEKSRKDKLWLVKITIPTEYFEAVKNELIATDIPFTYYDLNKYYVVDTYCERQQQTTTILNICKKYKGKAFATENKLGL